MNLRACNVQPTLDNSDFWPFLAVDRNMCHYTLSGLFTVALDSMWT